MEEVIKHSCQNGNYYVLDGKKCAGWFKVTDLNNLHEEKCRHQLKTSISVLLLSVRASQYHICIGIYTYQQYLFVDTVKCSPTGDDVRAITNSSQSVTNDGTLS